MFGLKGRRFFRVWQRVEGRARQKTKGELEYDQRAVSAKAVLVNATFNEAYACVRQDLQDEWMATDDPDKRAALYAEVKSLSRVIKKLEQFYKWREIQEARAQMQQQYQ